MADQSFNDRCALALGWRKSSLATDKTVHYWVDATGDWVMPVSDWNPSKNWDHAIRMRAECVARDMADEYLLELLKVIIEDTKASTGTLEKHINISTFLVLATAEQIARASLEVLESVE